MLPSVFVLVWCYMLAFATQAKFADADSVMVIPHPHRGKPAIVPIIRSQVPNPLILRPLFECCNSGNSCFGFASN